jgi:hypothetical protein
LIFKRFKFHFKFSKTLFRFNLNPFDLKPWFNFEYLKQDSILSSFENSPKSWIEFILFWIQFKILVWKYLKVFVLNSNLESKFKNLFPSFPIQYLIFRPKLPGSLIYFSLAPAQHHPDFPTIFLPLISCAGPSSSGLASQSSPPQAAFFLASSKAAAMPRAALAKALPGALPLLGPVPHCFHSPLPVAGARLNVAHHRPPLKHSSWWWFTPSAAHLPGLQPYTGTPLLIRN